MDKCLQEYQDLLDLDYKNTLNRLVVKNLKSEEKMASYVLWYVR